MKNELTIYEEMAIIIEGLYGEELGDIDSDDRLVTTAREVISEEYPNLSDNDVKTVSKEILELYKEL